MRAAHNLLDIDMRSIAKKINYPDLSSYSPTLKESVTFVDKSIEMREGSPRILDMPIYPGLDMDSIPAGEIHLLNDKLEIIEKFNGLKEAASSTGVSTSDIKYNMNKQFIICSVDGNDSFMLFARNINEINLSSVSVIVIDTLKNNAYYFSTAVAAITALRIRKSAKSGFITSRYLNTNKKYKQRFLFVKPSDYQGSLPLIKTGEPIISDEEAKDMPKGKQKSIVLYNIFTRLTMLFYFLK